MRKTLIFIVIIFSLLYTPFLMAQTSLNLTPSSSFAGVTKKGSIYTSQTLKDNYSEFFVGYDAAKDTYGRGYLEFDLTSIPKKATIISAILKLRSVTGSGSNFEGSIKVYSIGIQKTANENTWIDLGRVSPEILSVSSSKAGTDLSLSSETLKMLIKNNSGSSIYLSIKHPDESKIIRFSGELLATTLEIKYTEDGGNSTGGSSNGREMLPIPNEVLAEKEFTLGFVSDPGSFYKIKGWEYDSSMFSEKSRGKGTITLIPKQLIGTKYTYVTLYVETEKDLYIFYKRFTWTFGFPVIGTPHIIRSEPNICPGEEIKFNIANFIGSLSDIKWENGTNMALVSSAGTSAVFRPTGTIYAPINDFGSVKAKVKTLQNIGYSLETKLWLGTPKVALQGSSASSIFSTFVDISNTITFSEFTTLSMDGYGLISGPDSNFEWQSSSGESMFTTGNGVISNPIDNGKGSIGKVATFKLKPGTYYSNLMFKIRAKNECGWSDWKYIAWSGSVVYGGYGVRSASFIEAPTLENSKEIKSVKVYNLSGVLVYSNNTINASFDIKSTVLADGVYIIEKFDGQNRTSEKVILKR